MKILAVDTATKICSVAMIDDGSLLVELTTGRNETHSKHLLEIIITVIAMSGLEVSDVDGFAVTIGPGSFTGLRIGISTIKGLAFAGDKPVVGISSLDALAWQCAHSAYLICSILDARKAEVYFCRYRFKNGELKKEGIEQVATPPEAVLGIREPCIFVGNGAQMYQEIISAELGEFAYFAPLGQHTIRASSVAYLSMNRFSKNDTDDVASLVPFYIRKSDAELKVRKKVSH
jgi:tRNA threonylcarbamoyladenosine biosynthesis protein TsaB